MLLDRLLHPLVVGSGCVDVGGRDENDLSGLSCEVDPTVGRTSLRDQRYALGAGFQVEGLGDLEIVPAVLDVHDLVDVGEHLAVKITEGSVRLPRVPQLAGDLEVLLRAVVAS